MNQESIDAVLTALKYARRIFIDHNIGQRYLADFDTSCNVFTRDEWLTVAHAELDTVIKTLEEECVQKDWYP